MDTTCHEVQKDGKLNELYAATGGPWGGELVNKAFTQLMEKMVSVFRKLLTSLGGLFLSLLLLIKQVYIVSVKVYTGKISYLIVSNKLNSMY